jgi:ATP-dependent DNA helicase DinG
LVSSMWVSEKFAEYLRRSMLLNWEEYFQLKVSFEEPSEEEEKLIKKLKNYELLERRLQKVKEFCKSMKERPAELGFAVSRKWSTRLRTGLPTKGSELFMTRFWYSLPTKNRLNFLRAKKA